MTATTPRHSADIIDELIEVQADRLIDMGQVPHSFDREEQIITARQMARNAVNKTGVRTNRAKLERFAAARNIPTRI